MTPTDRKFERLRRLCLSLPEAREVEAWGHPTFRAGNKIFASVGFRDDRPCVGLKAERSDQDVLVDDVSIFRSKYVGQHGWITVLLDGKIDWGMIEDLVLNSYRLVALKRMVKALDARGDAR